MSQAQDTIEGLPFRAAPALDEIARGMDLKKCRKCGCMKDALDQAERAFESAEEPEIRSLVLELLSIRRGCSPWPTTVLVVENVGVQTLPSNSPTILTRWSLIFVGTKTS